MVSTAVDSGSGFRNGDDRVAAYVVCGTAVTQTVRRHVAATAIERIIAVLPDRTNVVTYP